jgi:valyl-tRNA synthetase
MDKKGAIRMQELSMPTKYDPQATEEKWNDFWLKGEYVEADQDPEKEPYTIVIPPSNVTGKLHLGHAWDPTLQDMLTRMQRMQGFDVL